MCRGARPSLVTILTILRSSWTILRTSPGLPALTARCSAFQPCRSPSRRSAWPTSKLDISSQLEFIPICNGVSPFLSYNNKGHNTNSVQQLILNQHIFYQDKKVKNTWMFTLAPAFSRPRTVSRFLFMTERWSAVLLSRFWEFTGVPAELLMTSWFNKNRLSLVTFILLYLPNIFYTFIY